MYKIVRYYYLCDRVHCTLLSSFLHMADAAGYAGSRKRYRDPEATRPFQVDSVSSVSRAEQKFMAKRRMIRRGGRSRTTRRRTGGSRRRMRMSARRTAASYVPPKTNVSYVGRRGQQLVERSPVHIQRSLNPFPPMWKGHFSYGINTAITCVGSVPTFVVNAYGMNNMFDPETSFGGTQPYQYDQLTGTNGPYTQVQVLGFSFSVRFTDPTADGAIVGVFWRGYGDALGNPSGQTYQAIVEKGRCDTQSLNNTGSQTADFSGYIDLPSLVGLTPDQYMGQLEYGHSYNANPLKRLDFYLGLCDPNSLVSPLIVRAVGWLRFHCVLSGLVSSPQS